MMGIMERNYLTQRLQNASLIHLSTLLAKIEKKSAQIIKKMLAEKKKEYHAAKKKLDEDYSSFLKTVYSWPPP